MAALRAEYEGGSEAFVSQIDWLTSRGYIGVRRARGDGDCFYRCQHPIPPRVIDGFSLISETITALAFAYISMILESSDDQLAVAAAISTLESTAPKLEDAGFQKLVYEDFYEVLASLIKQVVTPEAGGSKLTTKTLLEAFQSPEGELFVISITFIY